MTTERKARELKSLADEMECEEIYDPRIVVQWAESLRAIARALESAQQPEAQAGGAVGDVANSIEELKKRGMITSLAKMPPASEAQAGGAVAEPPSNEVWPPDGAIWLAPVATDAPANPKLMQYAWGRSSLSSGQMAEAYQCIVSAAQECGQVYRLPLAAPATPPAQVPEGQFSEEWKAGFSAGCDAVLNPAPRLATIFPEIEERIRRLNPPSDVVGGPEGYGFMRGIEAARAEVRRVERIYQSTLAAAARGEG